jgi:hypothetical protein
MIGCSFATGRRQTVFGPLAARGGTPLQHAGALQPAQPFHKQGAGHVRQTALDLVEMLHVGKKLANDEHRPAVCENLRRPRNRTVLAVAVHERAYHAVPAGK